MRTTWWRPAGSTLVAAFLAASAVWAVLLVVAPLAASRPHASPLSSVLILVVYGVGSLVCHQRPERSYTLWTTQMPVCARCAGIYYGAVLGGFASACLARARRYSLGGWRAPHRLALAHPRTALALAAAPTAITLVYEWTTGDMPSHAIRAAAGALIGAVVAGLVVAAAENQVN